MSRVTADELRRYWRSGSFAFGLGLSAGWLLSPIFGAVSFVRRARTFHPRGVCFRATASRHPRTPKPLRELAQRLEGRTLVRFSGALWKRGERLPDVLGCALRFTEEGVERAEAMGADQDLLFATIRRPWTMPFSPFTTEVRDYLANDYFGVSPFDVGLLRPLYLRLHPESYAGSATSGSGALPLPADGERAADKPADPNLRLAARAHSPAGASRAQRLQAAVENGTACLTLEASDGPFGPWMPFLQVHLAEPAKVNEQALRFNPFHAGRGFRPRGLVHALRMGVYAVSQAARPSS